MLKKTAQYIFVFCGVLMAGILSIHAQEPNDYRQAMRELVQSLAQTARAVAPRFIVIPQNGAQLLTMDGKGTGKPAAEYLRAIDGQGQESLFYGAGKKDYTPSPVRETAELMGLLNVARNNGKAVFIIDYCRKDKYLADAFRRGEAAGFITYGADNRELHRLPHYPQPARHIHSQDVGGLLAVRNFLALLNPEKFPTKAQYLKTLADSAYDMLIIDAEYDGVMLTSDDVARLRRKPQGGQRLLISYFSIGEAEEYRDYWRKEWKKHPPRWLCPENPRWRGNYKVRYWHPEWRNILNAGLRKIINAGFDGVYLDIIDGFEYFEDFEEK